VQLDAQTVAIVVAAVTFTADRAIALVKAARERVGNGSEACTVAHERMRIVIDRLATLQEKEIDILQHQTAALEIIKLIVDRRDRGRSYSPLSVDMLRDLDDRRNEVVLARQQMSDPPPEDAKKK
jgi:hypothetical protein